MKLCNPLKSMTWNSLLRRSSRRTRRRRTSFAPLSLGAEVLENRQLLSNVNLSVVAGAITLTATDGDDHSVDVHRVDSTNVEFDPFNGTQITYLGVAHSSSFDVAIPTVASVKVKLGTGYDTYDIHNLSVLGNITFCGNKAGEAGDDLEVFSDDSDMTIGGSVIFKVLNQHGGQPETDDDSFQEVFTDSTGNLTINGSIIVIESGTVYNETDVATDYFGDLLVKGSIFITQTGNGNHENFIETDEGDLTVWGLISFYETGTNYHENDVNTDGDGNLTVGLGIFNTMLGGDDQEFFVFTDGSGNLTVNGLVTSFIKSSGYQDSEVFTESGSGNLSVAGIIITELCTTDESDAFVHASSSGNLNVGLLGVTITDSGTGSHFNEIYTDNTGSVFIKGSVVVTDLGSGANESEFEIEARGEEEEFGGGNITICGSVVYSNALNKAGHDDVFIDADTSDGSGVVTIKGAVTLLLAHNAADGNRVEMGGDFDESETQVTIGGPVLITSGAGTDDIEINSVLFNSLVTINTGTNPVPGEESTGDEVEIAGSQFNGAVTIIMSGPGAAIEVNSEFKDDTGFPPTVFNGPFVAIMRGPGASIFLSNDSDSGTPVVFNSIFEVIGGIGGFPAGTVFIQGPVHFAFSPILINFDEVS